MTSQLAILGGEPVRTEPWPVWPQYSRAVKEALARVAESNIYCAQAGKEVGRFEEAFAAYHGVGHAVGMANGTVVLQAALAAAGIGCGDEVIVPSYTFVATGMVVVENNAIPVFVDCERTSQGLDPEDVRRKITPRTRAIMAVHINGYPCDMDAIMAIAREHNLVVIEDCAHAHGAEYKGRKVGTIGQFGCFSFQMKKNLSVGEGGMVITDDAEAADRMRQMRGFSWTNVTRNWRMGEFYGAIGAEQIKLLDEGNARRRANVATLLEAMGTVAGLTPLPGLPDTRPVYYNLILQYDESVMGVSRQTFVKALNAEGIPVSMFYMPIQRWPTFPAADFFGKGCPFSCPLREGGPVDYRRVSTPVADAVCERINIEIRVQPTSGEREMKHVAEAIRKVVANKSQLVEVQQGVEEGTVMR
jgi:dTDP-4-amino-4,6-dideoxygalactose transaminase